MPAIVMLAAGAIEAKLANRPAQHRPLRMLFMLFSFYAPKG